MNGPIPDVSIVIVSWQVRDLLKRSLASIAIALNHANATEDLLKAELIVIDNHSSDGTALMVRADFPDVTLVVNSTNRGFAAACNQARPYARGRYVFFLNPDTSLAHTDLVAMVRFMDAQSHVGLIGPRLEYANGVLQPSCRRFPTVWSQALVLLKLQYLWPNSLILRRYMMTAFAHQTLRQVDQIMGAALFVRRSALDTIGWFDDRFFLWFDEVDLCKRLTQAGYIILFFPWTNVTHERGRSFSQQRPLWRQWHFAQSARHYFWKHHTTAAAAVISILSYLSLLPALLLEGAQRFRELISRTARH